MTTKSQMNIDVDFTGVEESKLNSIVKLDPGVYDLTITGLEFGAEPNDKKTPYVDITVVAAQGQHTGRFYLTPLSLPRLKHILSKAGVPDTILSGKATSEQLQKAAVGKEFHGRLNGREYLTDKGVKRIAVEFAFSNYAQPINEPCTLVFDPAKHIKRLDTANNVSTTLSLNSELVLETPKTDDMPF
jgi:hypothetical protein